MESEAAVKSSSSCRLAMGALSVLAYLQPYVSEAATACEGCNHM